MSWMAHKGGSAARRGLLGALVLLVAVAGTAFGASVGDPLKLGLINTLNDAATRLTGANTGPMLQVTNTKSVAGARAINAVNNSASAAAIQVQNNGGGPAAGFVVTGGVPPIAVNSAGRVANLNSDLLDGYDSTNFTRGNGMIRKGAISVAPGTFGSQFFLGFSFNEVAPSPWVGLYYACPADLANPGTLVIRNDGSETINVFSDNGGANPSDYRQISSGGQYDQAASATGEHITIQVQGAGMATIEVFSIHRASDCHAQGMAFFSY